MDTATLTQLIIIQPTPLCNIDCSYCYLPDRLNNSRLSLETVTNIAKFIFSETSPVKKKVTIVWHAGEPLVMPISFYRSAFEIIKHENKSSLCIGHAFQTNGTLITQDWCSFITEANVSVGVSLDGPKHLHDANRKTRSGLGTFEATMRGIRLLQDNDIDFHVLAVLTLEALDQAQIIWDFFMESGITRLGFNVEEIEGVNRKSSLVALEALEKYRRFFSQLQKLRDKEKRPIFIRELDYMFDVIRNGRSDVRGTENIPGCILNFGYDGAVSTFSPELLSMKDARFGDFIFADANIHQFDDLLKSQKFLQVHDEILRGIEACKSECDYFSVCGGGSPSNKLYENGAFCSTETMSCQLRIKALTDCCLEYLESLPRYNPLLSSNVPPDKM